MMTKPNGHVCEICHHATHRWQHPKTKTTFYVCPHCEHIRRDPTNDPSCEEEKTIYDFHKNTLENKGYVRFLNDFATRSLIPYVNEGHVLDLGSGPNPVFAHLLKEVHHYNVSIYDPIYADDDTVFQRSYDAVTMSETIEHIHHIDLLFNMLNDVLREGSVLAVMTLFRPKTKEDFFKWWYIRDETHVRFFNRRTFEEIATIHGYDILDCDGKRKITLRKR